MRRALLDEFRRKNDTTDVSWFETEAGRADLQNHLIGRTNWFRDAVIPWLSSEMPLEGSRILEIGAGTGSSTVVLSKAGAAHIDAIDIDEHALDIARIRAGFYELDDIAFRLLNATELDRLDGEPHDLIIFFASLEHMLHEERKVAIPLAWRRLRPGGWLCVIDTPNRLWYMDRHTSLLPFFHWLPDDVAVDYCRFVPASEIARRMQAAQPDQAAELLARLGRSISYHDFELTIGKMDELPRVSGMAEFYRNRDLAWTEQVWAKSPEGLYHAFLRATAPHVPPAFFEEGLNLVIRRDC